MNKITVKVYVKGPVINDVKITTFLPTSLVVDGDLVCGSFELFGNTTVKSLDMSEGGKFVHNKHDFIISPYTNGTIGDDLPYDWDNPVEVKYTLPKDSN